MVISDYTLNTYKYIIYDVLDKSEEVINYKSTRGIPGKTSQKDIASEIYTYFLTHYYKAIDLYDTESELSINWISDGVLNIIDIGANIGTVTFAYIDILQRVTNNISFNVIFIEPDEYRCELLNKAIKKYRELSNLNIQYHIINKNYESSIDEIELHIIQSDTIILMSNILNWITNDTWDDFQNILVRNIQYINQGYGCRAINIEATSPTNSHEKIEKMYKEIIIDETTKYYSSKVMPRFNNIKECYYYNPRRVEYRSNKNYYYGFLTKYKHFNDSIDIGFINIAYNKALYTCRNNFIYDNLEMKYVNLNFDRIESYIYELINTGRICSTYNYQYRIKKSKDKTRPLYIDDFINDIITTTIIITEGLEADKEQNENISFGNRIDKNMDSPYVYIPYYLQYFDKFKKKELEYSQNYSSYYKIDLAQYYNNISHEKIREILKNYKVLNKDWCKKQISLFISKDLIDCTINSGLSQGPDLSHMLANIYLKNFDDWFVNRFNDVKLLRYVDDMEILAPSIERCESVLKECKDYLKNELRLNINETKNKYGDINELLLQEKDIFFDKVKFLSDYVLRSLYKIDDKNYKAFIRNKEEFLKIYRKCLNRLGIFVSEEWLNIKINKEIEFISKLKIKFGDNRKLVAWINEKNIYDIKLKIGKIPEINSQKMINEWTSIFISKNEEFIRELNNLKKILSEKLEDIILGVKNGKYDDKECKSIFKFIINKIQIFKCMNLSKFILDIESIFPYFNQKVLSSYDECYLHVKEKLNNTKITYDSYDYFINIWLLGEYRKNDSVNILKDIYVKSYQDREFFINTLSTEALLKIGKIDKEFAEKLQNQLLQSEDYYFVRNTLLLLNITEWIDISIEIIESKNFKEERIVIFIEWIKNNKGINITNSAECIKKEYMENYPTYPIDITYISL